MCALIALAFFIFAGFFGVRLEQSQLGELPQLLTVEPTSVAIVPTQAISCAAPSTDQDINDMLALVGDTFASKYWTQTIDSASSQRTVTWVNNSLNGLAYLDYLQFDCGVTQAQIESYYSPQGFATIFSNYQSYTQTAQCEANGINLHEFDVTAHNLDYHADYWVRKVSPTRVEGFLLVFPTDKPAQQAEYAGKLFPDLPTCEAAAG